MTKSDDAVHCFRDGFTCSSTVFSTFSEGMGIDPDTAKKCSCGFGAGISKTGNICGAVSGAILVIGPNYGKTKPGNDAATEKTRGLVREFIREFSARHGSVNCRNSSGITLPIRQNMNRHVRAVSSSRSVRNSLAMPLRFSKKIL
ncbi:MAG: C-GCAxxG-C-C family protein [Methanomicrobiales archaeon]|nr:C-GCAxxG-C-C family protein [Methanomicrobiales archaeon]